MLRIVRAAGAVPAAVASLVAVASPAWAVSQVFPGVDGTFTQLQPRSPGVYGVELRGGVAGAADWEIGVGNQTSNPGTFNQGEYNWASASTHAFNLVWNASGLSITVGNVTVGDSGAGRGAPLVGDTLKIDLKGVSSLTLATLDGAVFNQALSSPGSYHFFSPDAWGGNGFTATGTLAVENGGRSRNGINFKVGDFAQNPAVPEPATWAMLIAGFGIVGAAACRRRAVAATA
jgi:hypothetical protein